MTILNRLEEWPERTAFAEDGHWCPRGYGPTEMKRIGIEALIEPFRAKWAMKEGRYPTHLLVGFDCRREFLNQVAHTFYGSVIMRNPGGSEERPFNGLTVLWTKQPGIRLMYSGEEAK